MRLIDNNKINLDLLKISISKPEIFTKSTAKFWDDEYISEQMLKFHLDPDIESASKTKATIEAEAEFIIKTTALSNGKTLLDLGCGPGLYVREFAKTGATVTGVDFSGRSIDFANQHVKSEYNNTLFIKMNYLDLNFKESFDIATVIYYDFSALSTTEQNRLLAKIHTALKDNGFFIFDVLTEYKKTSVVTNISVHEAGFWSPTPHLEILNSYLYEDPKTEGLQYTIIEEDGSTRVIRIYHRLFSLAEITKMLNSNGFQVEKVYQNLQGEVLNKDSETYGIIARKV